MTVDQTGRRCGTAQVSLSHTNLIHSWHSLHAPHIHPVNTDASWSFLVKAIFLSPFTPSQTRSRKRFVFRRSSLQAVANTLWMPRAVSFVSNAYYHY